MKINKLSLRVRIFLAMILLVIVSSLLIATVYIYQYNEETQDYHKQRLERKESAIINSLKFVIRETSYPVTTENIPLIFKTKIFEVADVHNLQINLYNFEGELLISSKADLVPERSSQCIDTEILNQLLNTAEHRFEKKEVKSQENFRSSYQYIYDQKFKPLAIINLPYLENDDFLAKELNEFLTRLSYTTLLILAIAVMFAFFLSKYITKSLKKISDKMRTTRLEKRNEKIDIAHTSEEISELIKSYNNMIDELEESAVILATNERERAWREMAKQVAHEIKNPLTPMRLSVQNFQRKFDPNDPEIFTKVNEYTDTLIQQIDTMSSIASAFSNFAKMPVQQNEQLNVVKIVHLALDIFVESGNTAFLDCLNARYPIALRWFGNQLNQDLLSENGLRNVPLADIKNAFTAEVTKVYEAFDANSLSDDVDYAAGWNETKRRTGNLPDSLYEIIRFKDTSGAH